MRIDDLLSRLQKVKKVGGGWAACCPAHDDRSPSLSIKEADDRILLHCHVGCEPEDVVAALGLTMGDLFSENVKTNNAAPLPARKTSHEARDAADVARRLEVARDIWRGTKPLAGTAGERYLRDRCCSLPFDDLTLRFHPSLYCFDVGQSLPALVAKVTEVVSGKTVGIHRIWFREGETKAVKKARLGSSVEPVCVRLFPVTGNELLVAEGVETALSIAFGGRIERPNHAPIWSCVDAGQLAKLPPFGGVLRLFIIADNDKAGLAAAAEAEARWTKAGRPTTVYRPPEGFNDYNDVTRSCHGR